VRFRKIWSNICRTEPNLEQQAEKLVFYFKKYTNFLLQVREHGLFSGERDQLRAVFLNLWSFYERIHQKPWFVVQKIAYKKDVSFFEMCRLYPEGKLIFTGDKKMISINGVQYHVEVKGQGFPMLLLHGFTGDSSTWDRVLPNLESYKTIALDLLGHGKTDSPEDHDRYRVEHAVEDLKRLLDELKIEKAFLLGYSMGGRLALAFAAAYPESVKALILESSSPGLRAEDERKERAAGDEKLANMIVSKGLEDFVDYWENIPLFSSQKSLPAGIQEEIRNNRLSQNPRGLANSLRGMGTGRQPSYWEELRHLPMEVLLVTGELDSKFCRIAEAMKEEVQNSTVIKVSGAGHALHVEEPEKFGTIVREFLKNT
jgi:2-succinyl-6-hydroxy-2,4-cyclohexadiene-1-carboxylate synthase